MRADLLICEQADLLICELAHCFTYLLFLFFCCWSSYSTFRCRVVRNTDLNGMHAEIRQAGFVSSLLAHCSTCLLIPSFVVGADTSGLMKP